MHAGAPRIAPWRLNLIRYAAAPATLALMLICVAVYVFLLARAGTIEQVLPWLAGWSHDVWDGRYWTLLTSAFVHVDLWHLVMNMLALRVLGTFMEVVLGGRRLVLFYLAAAFVSSGAEFGFTGTTGIGASGAIYAIFGFMWITRRRYPLFARIITRRNQAIAIGWLVLCVFLTAFDVLRIANAAHCAGLLFGAGTGAALTFRRWRWAASAGASALAAFALTALFWCPWLGAWYGWQAGRAHQRQDVEAATRWYRMAIAKGYNAPWAWHNLGLIATARHDWAGYQEVWTELSRLDGAEAARMDARTWNSVEQDYRSYIEQTLKPLGKAAAQTAAHAAADEGDEEQRSSWALVLGLLGNDAAIRPALERMAASDSSPKVRGAARLALRHLGKPETPAGPERPR